MKRHFVSRSIVVTAVLCIAALSAQADAVTTTISSTLSGSPGSTLTVTGDLANNDPSNTYYFITDLFPELDSPLTAGDLIIIDGLFGLGPASISPAGSSDSTLSGLDLFTLQIAEGTAPGTYGGEFQLWGDTDGSNCSPGDGICQLLSTVDFSVDITAAVVPTPEPSAFVLYPFGLLLIGALRFGQKFRQAI
jgi:hypothetical protein